VTVRLLGTDELETAVALLDAGGVVALPTDTVYGLAARIDDAAAVGRLFAAKGRPASVPIAVLCATVADARGLASSWPAPAAALAAFWPGPLTLVVPCDQALATRLGAPRGVGVRVPDDPTCRALLAVTGPLAVTSANQHGDAPATSAAAVVARFADGSVAAVLDGGTRDGVVSTVVDLTGQELAVVREGALDPATLRAALSQA
jgi:tRNA threonylcarbamoyl adenosine modification protein (Sua5/YciO/YrdC/YwlC family)